MISVQMDVTLEEAFGDTGARVRGQHAA